MQSSSTPRSNASAGEPDTDLCVGELTLDLTTRIATRGQRLVRLAPSHVAMLATFMRHPHRPFSRDELIRLHPSSTRGLDRRIARLRDTLGHDVIHTTPDGALWLGGLGEAPAWLQAGALELHPVGQLFFDGYGPVECSRRETRVMVRMIRAVGRAVDDAELMRVTGISPGEQARYHEMIFALREKLRALGAGHPFVRVEGGYRLAATEGLRRIGGIELDLLARSVRLNGRPLELWPAWFAMLERLAVVPGAIVSPGELLDHVWGEASPPAQLSAIVDQLRGVLAEGGAPPVTWTGDGWRLAVERVGVVAVGALLLDPVAACARIEDREEQLGTTEAVVLAALMRADGGVVSRASLCAATGDRIGEHHLASILTHLRRKLRRLSGGSELFVAVRNAGVRLAVEHLRDDRFAWPLRFGDVLLRPHARRVRCASRMSSLGPQPAAMLTQLIVAGGDVVTDAALAQLLWPESMPRFALSSCCGELRRVLAKIGATVRVERVFAVGYRLVASSSETASGT
jgi:DNA-binding response OmpR family regulator